jgi:cytoskeletal protein CcmA (bactofilin family)
VTIMSDTQTRPDTRIAGAGEISGGVYGSCVIGGAGTVRGPIDCTTFKVGGAADVQGDLTATQVSVGGTATFNGFVHGGNVTISGTGEVRGDLKADILKVAGTATFGGRIDAQRVEIRGTAKMLSDVSAESFDAQGVFAVTGLLNAGTITIRLYGGCDAHDIGGEKIDVRLGSAWAFLPFFGERNLTVDAIEGDTVYLENTRAKVVRGKDVTIGAGCDIELVEYTGTLSGSAGVRASRKVEPAA